MRWSLGVLATLIVLFTIVVVVLRLRFHGEALAKTIAQMLNSNIRGRVEVRSVEWPTSSLISVVTGGWIPVTIRGLQVYDDGGSPDAAVEDSQRNLVLSVDEALAYIDAHSLMFGHHDFIIKDIQVPKGGYTFIKEVREPYPLHDYDTTVFSLVSAFYSYLQPGFRAGMSAHSTPIFDIQHFTVEDVTVEILYTNAHVIVEGVKADGFVRADLSDPLDERVYFALHPTATRGLACLGMVEPEERRPMRAMYPPRPPGAGPDYDYEAAAELCRGKAVQPRMSQGEFATIYPIPLEQIEVNKLAQLPMTWPRDPVANDIEWAVLTRTPDAALLHLTGALRDYWVGLYGGDFDNVALSIENGGSLVQHLTDGVAGGDDLHIDLHASGPSIGPRFEVVMNGLDIRMPIGQPPLDLHFTRAKAAFDMVTEEGSLADTVAFGAGGEVELAASFALDPFRFDLEGNITKSIDVGEYLPPEISKIVGQRIRGHLHMVGNGDRYKLDELDLWLGKARLSGELAYDDSRGVVSTGNRQVRPFTVQLGQSSLVTSGGYHVVDGSFRLGVHVNSSDLGHWLRRFDLPPLGTALHGSAQLGGTIDDPVGRAELAVAGVPLAQTVTAKLGYQNEVVTVRSAESHSLGGHTFATGRIRVGGPRVRLEGMKATARGLDLSKMPVVGGMLSGRVDASATASGPVARLDSRVDLALSDLVIAGDSYQQIEGDLCGEAPVTRLGAETPDARAGAGTRSPGRASPADRPERFTVRTLPSGEKELRLCLGRKNGEGALGVRTTVDKQGNVDGRVHVADIPIHDLQIFGGKESPVGGKVSADLALAGTTSAPAVAGSVSWLDTWLGDAFIGAGAIDVSMLDSDRIGVHGTLMNGDVDVDLALQTVAPYASDVRLRLRRVGIDRFFPELASRYGVRGWVSGEVVTHNSGLPPTLGKTTASVRLTEVELWKDSEDAFGRPAPVRLYNKRSTPIVIAFDGNTASLEQDVILVGPGGAEFVMSGQGNLEELALDIEGDITVALFEAYTRDLFDSTRGKVNLRAHIGGTILDPRLDITLTVAEAIAVRPTGQDAFITVQSGGLLRITNDQITPTGLHIGVRDPYTGERTSLEVRGGIKMEQFKPVRLALDIDGELSSKLFLVALPRYFSRASGAAQLFVSVRGDPRLPRIDGDISFDSERPMSMAIRGLPHEIRLTRGTITFTDDSVVLGSNGAVPGEESRIEVAIAGLAGTLADEGQITDLSGDISLVDWQPDSVDVTVSADSLPFRIPKELDLTVNISNLHILGNAKELYIGGDEAQGSRGIIEVIDGRYVRNFNWISDVIRPEANSDSSPPFYETIPLLADAELDLLVETRGFFVQNNVADIELVGDVDVKGTPRRPRLDGDIRVVQGEFRIPGLRPVFSRTTGGVTFSGFKKFPDDTPTIDFRSESDFRDPSGQEHLITLRITGPLDGITWDLGTSTGLNKGQTTVLIALGRTPEEFRQQLGDTAPGLATNRVETSTNPNEGAADEILRELAGDFISLYIGDKLRNITKLDVARLEIGTGSIGFHGEKEFFKNLRMLGDFEQTLRGRTWDLRGEVRLSDHTSVEGNVLTKNFEDDSEEDFRDSRLRAVWRFFIP